MKNQFTADLKFLQLCDEIDMWKNEAEFYKEKYEEVTKEYAKLLDTSLNDAKHTAGQLLTIMFNSEQTENGILIKHNLDKL